MKLKTAFIFFYLILSVININLKKKNENKKSLNRIITSFLQNKKKEDSFCDRRNYKLEDGSECTSDMNCISFKCRKNVCSPSPLKKLGQFCLCDYHCESGHCSFQYWLLFDIYYTCTEH